MKVAVVLAQPPLPEGSAQGRCAVALLRGLLAHGVDVRAIAARWHGPGTRVPDDLPVEVLDIGPRGGGLRAAMRNVWHPRSVLAHGPFGARVRELAADADVLHLEESVTGWCSGGETPTLVHFHYLSRSDQDLPRPWQHGFLLALEHARADRLVARRHRCLVASSPVVAADLRRVAPRAQVTLAPLSLDPAYYDAAPLDGPPVAGLIGTGSWGPTRSAMERAVRIWPLVARRVPDAVLRVAGWGTADLPLAGAGVELVGEVPSTSRFLGGLSVLLYPVPRGSGMKVKVMESLASGLPVVTTPAGAEGVDGGAGVVIATTDEELADATVRLLVDADERRERGRAGRLAFEARYAPVAATDPLIGLYRGLASTSG